MRRLIIVMIVAFLLSAVFPAVRADDIAARLEAIILVKKAVAFLKENGRAKALQEFSNPRGRFVGRNHHLFAYEPNGKCVANATAPNMVGKTVIDIAKRSSKTGAQETDQDVSKNEIGWKYCIFTDPVSNKSEKKIAYLERTAEMIIGCSLTW